MKLPAFASLALFGSLAPSPALAQWGAPQGQQQQQQQQYGGSGSQQNGSMQSGGLAPPAPMPSDSESARTEEELQKAEVEDSGRGLEFFYLNAEVGVQHLGLQTFSASDLVDAKVVDTTQTGLLVGAGLGLRLVFITIGPRFRLASFSDYQVWTLDAEVGLRIPIGSVEPYLLLGGGYASLGSFDASKIGAVSPSKMDITGYNARLGGGIDLYLTPVFSVGASATFEMLGLSRSKIQGTVGTAADVYAADGSSLGSAVTGTAVVGLHF